jgi:hypothetical protein
MHIVTELAIDAGKAPPEHQRVDYDFRRDGDLLDVVGTFEFLDKFQDQSYHFHSVVNPEYSLDFQYSLGGKGPATALNLEGPVYTTEEPTYLFQQRTTIKESGLALDGYVPQTDWRRVTEHLLESEDVRVRGEDTLGGVPCKVVTGRTPYGTMTVWIAPGEGHAIRKTEYLKGPDDLPQRGDANFKFYQAGVTRQLWKFVVDGVEVEKIGDAYVPIRGHARETLELTDHTRKVVDRKVVDATYTRTRIVPGPPDRGGGLFTMTDLPEDSRVASTNRDGLNRVLLWREGKLGGNDADTRAAADAARAPMPEGGAAGLGGRVLAQLTVIGLACVLFYRFRRRRKPA